MPRHVNRILNLSDIKDIDFSFLEKGLNFVPVISRSTCLYEENLRSLLVSLKSRSNYNVREIKSNQTFNYSSKTVNECKSDCEFIKLYLNTLNNSVKQNEIDNLSHSEKMVLHNLRRDRRFIIKPADKGSIIVIQNREDYEQECLRQLGNTQYYKPLSAPYYLITSKMITTCIQSMVRRGEISSELAKKLYPPSVPRPRWFYILPKIHKPKEK